MDQHILVKEQIPDETLIDRIVSGEKKLFEHIIRSHNQRLFRIGMSILNNDMETEDAMQMAYINAYENLHSFQKRSTVTTWISRIMINECLARKKKKMKFRMEIERQAGTPVNMTTPASVLANKELSTVLENSIARLPEKYRLVFVLREIEEMSVRQTSETLNIEESNVKARLSRAKTMLRENLSGFMRENVYSFHLLRCDRIVSNVLSRI